MLINEKAVKIRLRDTKVQELFRRKKANINNDDLLLPYD